MLTLVVGGAASGKSAFAEAVTTALPGPRLYLAAMEPFGEEARARIARHRALRAGKGFQTLERYVDLSGAPLPAGANVLLEDLGNLAANELYRPDGGGEAAALAGVLAAARCAHLTVVTNEVFSGGMDYEGDTLRYLGALARLNRALAARADTVVEVVCGLPNLLKGELPW
jgi:adenosylcobinamide kinase/adenosylcobinamide-phosphate guanylyltransferase